VLQKPKKLLHSFYQSFWNRLPKIWKLVILQGSFYQAWILVDVFVVLHLALQALCCIFFTIVNFYQMSVIVQVDLQLGASPFDPLGCVSINNWGSASSSFIFCTPSIIFGFSFQRSLNLISIRLRRIYFQRMLSLPCKVVSSGQNTFHFIIQYSKVFTPNYVFKHI